MAVSTNRSRISEILGTDSTPKKKPLYDPQISETGSRIAQILEVETPQIAQQELFKPVIGPTTYNWVEEGYVDAATPAWQKALATGPVGGFFNIIQKPLALTTSLAKESIDLATGQGFDFELVSLICKNRLRVEEVFIDYVPRKNSSDKKIKFYSFSYYNVEYIKTEASKYCTSSSSGPIFT